MSRRRGAATASSLALFAVFAVCGWASPARAQHLEGQASVTLTGSYTRSWSDLQNATAQTFSGPALALSPILVGILDTPRTENALTYALSLTAPFIEQAGVHQASFTAANRLAYAGRYALGELTSMTFSTAFTESPLNTFVPSQDPSSAPIQPVPAGTGTMFALNVAEGIAQQITETTSLSQAAAFAYGAPVGLASSASQTYTGQNTLGWMKTFLYDAVGTTLTTQINHFTAGAGIQESSVYVGTLALDYTHAFTESLSLALTPGVTATMSPGASTLSVVQPSGSASLRYDHRFAAAALVFAHQAVPNLVAATVEFDDTASLRFAVPFGKTGLTTSGTAGFVHSTPIPGLKPVSVIGPANLAVVDGSLDYYPRGAQRFAVGFRGQFARQVLAIDAASSFTRYTLSLHLTYAYPTARPLAIRPELAPAYGIHAPSQTDIVSSDRVLAP